MAVLGCLAGEKHRQTHTKATEPVQTFTDAQVCFYNFLTKFKRSVVRNLKPDLNYQSVSTKQREQSLILLDNRYIITVRTLT